MPLLLLLLLLLLILLLLLLLFVLTLLLLLPPPTPPLLLLLPPLLLLILLLAPPTPPPPPAPVGASGLWGTPPFCGCMLLARTLILDDEMSGMIFRCTGVVVTGGLDGLASNEASIWLRSLNDRVSLRLHDGPSSGSGGRFWSMWMPSRCTSHSAFLFEFWGWGAFCGSFVDWKKVGINI